MDDLIELLESDGWSVYLDIIEEEAKRLMMWMLTRPENAEITSRHIELLYTAVTLPYYKAKLSVPQRLLKAFLKE